MRRQVLSGWIGWGLACLVLWAMPSGGVRRLRGVSRDGLAPLQAAAVAWGGRLRTAADVLRGWGGWVGENRRLAEEVAHLRSRVLHLEALQQENLELRRQLRFLRTSGESLVPAEVIGRDISGWWESVRIARGERDGIRKGMAVITPEGLAGRVDSVMAHTADVLLLSDASLRVSARIRRTGAFGVVRGGGSPWRGDSLCRMDYIALDSTVIPGDEVVTSGLGSLYTGGLFIGRVERVTRDPSGLYQSVTVVPGANLADLTHVFLVLGNSVPARDADGEGPPWKA